MLETGEETDLTWMMTEKEEVERELNLDDHYRQEGIGGGDGK